MPIVKLHVAEAFVTNRGVRIPCKIAVAEETAEVRCPTLAGLPVFRGRYDPGTHTLYEYAEDACIPVMYRLPQSFLCCVRDPYPGEKLLTVTVMSEAVSKALGDSNKGTQVHSIHVLA